MNSIETGLILTFRGIFFYNFCLHEIVHKRMLKKVIISQGKLPKKEVQTGFSATPPLSTGKIGIIYRSNIFWRIKNITFRSSKIMAY